MNETETQNINNAQDVFAPLPRTEWTPHLEFYHPNAKGTGSALRFSIAPAESDRDGSLFVSFAAQSSVFVPAQNGAPAKFASFDWRNRIPLKFTFAEVAEIILVLRGVLPSVGQNARGDGFYHKSSSSATSVTFRHGDDPSRPGFLLDVSRVMRTNPNEKQHVGIMFNLIEAVGLQLALEQSMALLAFGIPRPRGPRTSVPESTGSALGAPMPPPPAVVA